MNKLENRATLLPILGLYIYTNGTPENRMSPFSVVCSGGVNHGRG